jgi:hypothetical protein
MTNHQAIALMAARLLNDPVDNEGSRRTLEQAVGVAVNLFHEVGEAITAHNERAMNTVAYRTHRIDPTYAGDVNAVTNVE